MPDKSSKFGFRMVHSIARRVSVGKASGLRTTVGAAVETPSYDILIFLRDLEDPQ
jgi:hypothetical protein